MPAPPRPTTSLPPPSLQPPPPSPSFAPPRGAPCTAALGSAGVVACLSCLLPGLPHSFLCWGQCDTARAGQARAHTHTRTHTHTVTRSLFLALGARLAPRYAHATACGAARRGGALARKLRGPRRTPTPWHSRPQYTAAEHFLQAKSRQLLRAQWPHCAAAISAARAPAPP